MAEGHRQRLRERVKERGLEQLYPHEVLEYLLLPLIPRRDTNQVAHKLLAQFGSLYAVLSAAQEELEKVQGVSPMVAEFLSHYLQAVRLAEGAFQKEHAAFCNVESVKRFVRQQFSGVHTEMVLLVATDATYNVTTSELVSAGSADTVATSKRLILDFAIKCQAKKIVIAHNHLKGKATPSAADLKATFLLLDLLRSIEVEFLDNIVLAPEELFSFRIAGALGDTLELEAEMRKEDIDFFIARDAMLNKKESSSES